MYAGRKRRKPVVRGVKPATVEVVKSNPSKRHRDRLNSELDRLAALLPFPPEVTSSLDKLSILRLSVIYLRTKNFFSVALKNHNCKGLTPGNGSNHDNGRTTELVDGWMPEGELLLQALNGFVLVITAEGVIFYCSHTIQDYLGFHQTDVMHQSVFELIHTEDQQEFRRNLHWALNPPCSPIPTDGDPVPSSSVITYNPEQLPPENSSFLERSFACRFRCLLDNSSGFLGLNLQGRLKFLHGQNQHLGDGGDAPPQLALFTIATPLQPPSILEIRTKNMIFRTKHKLDFTPMACDARGKIVLGYTEAELRVRGSGYQFIHAADMLYCAENHVRMIKTGESGLTVFRLLTKDNRWKWVQANARLVYKNGKPDYIIATQRPLVEEEGGEHLRKRSMHLPFTFATGEALLYQTSYPLHGAPPGSGPSTQGKAGGKGGAKSKRSKADKTAEAFRDTLDPASLLGALMRQDESVYVCQPAQEPKMSFHSSLLNDSGSGNGYDGGLPLEGGVGASSWNATNTTHPGGAEPSTFDPLLATLDSLSLEGGEEVCSNSELFGALESLGLDAEDLELLLLDERMIRVEVEPGYIPSLNDLLTNNEILSYVHDSLEGRTEEEAERRRGGSATAVESSSPLQPQPPTALSVPNLSPAPVPLSQATTPPQPASATIGPPSRPPKLPRPPKPIVKLSQQMQERVRLFSAPSPAPSPSASPAVVHHTTPNWCRPVPLPTIPATSTRADAERPTSSSMHGDSHWASPMELSHNCHQDLRTLCFNGQASETIRQQQHQHQQLQASQPWHQPNPVPLPSQCHFKKGGNGGGEGSSSSAINGVDLHRWGGYGGYTHSSSPANNSRLPSNHLAAGAPCVDYGTAGLSSSGGRTLGEGCHYQRVSNSGSSSSYPPGPAPQRQPHLQQHFQSQAMPSSIPGVVAGFTSYPAQMELELEQILGISQQSQHSAAGGLDPYGLFSHPANGSQDGTCNKVENGCILSNSSMAYTGGCLLPNGNDMSPGDSPPPCLDPLLPTLSALPDPQTTSFYH